MNIAKGAAIAAAGVVVGVGLTVGVVFKLSQQGQIAESLPVASPTQATAATVAANLDRLETKNLIFQNVKISRYTGEAPAGSDVAGELYQVSATITNRSSETMSPSGLSGVTYKLRDSQDRKYQTADFMIGVGDEGLKSTDGVLPGQTREGITVGVFDVLPGATGLELGVNDGMFSDIKYVSPPQQVQAAASAPAASPILVSATAPAQPASQAASPIAAAAPNFDLLPPCDQIDSVAKSGKSVSEFLVAAGRVGSLPKYQTAIASICPWNAEQLVVADRVLNPPVVVVKPRVIRSSGVVEASSSRSSGSSSSSSSSSWTPAAPAPRWNNCNGIQEPGESYSGRCEAAQEAVDDGTASRRQKRIDNRPPDSDRPANGYSAQ